MIEKMKKFTFLVTEKEYDSLQVGTSGFGDLYQDL